jgi:hypothetical protein
MAIPLIDTAFSSGEITPSLFGHVDLAKFHVGASTMRNLFVSYRGGAYSRAGTAFVGFSKQTGRLFPPRLITFQFSINQGLMLEFGNFYMRVVSNGAFVTETPIPITGISQSNPIDIQVANNFAPGDGIAISGVNGMTQVNGQTYVVTSASPTQFTAEDAYGNPINSTAFSAYISGGFAARIFTLTTPYAEQDLIFLKFTQSADVMTLCCFNQISGKSYPIFNLTRISDDNWTLLQPNFGPTITPPVGLNVNSFGSGSTQLWAFSYQVTAVNNQTGDESIASSTITITNTANPAITQNSITVTWQPVLTAGTYNVYRALGSVFPGPDLTASAVPIGSLFGFVGTVYGTSFTDSNITADFTKVPPTAQNPFAPGQILSVLVNTPGEGFNQLTTTATMVSATGTGAILQPVVIQGQLVSIIVLEAGQNYMTGDTVLISGGAGATATADVGPSTGTFPSVPAYFQERLVYANTPNQPDTYFISQPGLFNNFNSRIPTIPSDAIIGSPWSVEVNGIQFMLNMPGGLVVLTGLSAWQLTGAGGSSLNPQPLTPASQQAQPQTYNGCSSTVPPIKIDLNILYVQAKGSIVRNLEYQIFQNQYFGNDITVLSSQLFTGFTIDQWAYAEEPFKIIWAVRNDGVALSLTYLKQQDVIGWSRHDTHGMFKSVTSVTEPPVDAVYFATQRFFGTNKPYFIERMDNRIWEDIEQTYCVDAGLQNVQSTPNATLSVSSSTGLGSIVGFTNQIGGTEYSINTTATIVDDNGEGPGAGAVVSLIVNNGVITSFNIANPGTGYVNPALVINDPLGFQGGTGASAMPILNNSATFTATGPVFTPQMATQSWVIRIGGGIATITQFISSTQVIANITSPITEICPNGSFVIPATESNWTVTEPITVVSGLNHLIGATVTGIADGIVIPPQVVSPTGTITLQTPATAITVGLAYQVQLQSVYLDSGNPTVQGQRKKIANVTARVEASGSGITIGSNQPDGSVQSPIKVETTWQNMQPANVKSVPAFGSSVFPLFTGDIRIPVEGGYDVKGQVALQQLEPLPMQVLALIPEFDPGDVPQPPGPQMQQRGR